MKTAESKIIMYKGIILGAVVMGLISIFFYQSQILNAKETKSEPVNIESSNLGNINEGEDQQTKNQDDIIKQINRIYERAATQATPSVVTVYASKLVRQQDQFNPFEYFFKSPRGGNEKSQKEDDRTEQRQSGSGVILSKDGYIVTNNHVIEGVDEIKVKLFDKREYLAELVGADPLTDLALLRVKDINNFTPIIIGNSENLRIGDNVMSIGNPLSIGISVTTGIVSALNRKLDILQNNYAIEKFIQTDAAINPGNSGGALINLNGELIGINSAIASGTGYFAGYGFAVPVIIMNHVVDHLKKYGKVRRGYLGISLEEVDYKIAKEKGWEIPKGVYVKQVQDDMPAKDAGIEQDDIILKVDGVAVNEPNDIQGEISNKDFNATVNVEIYRDSKTINKKVTLKERDSEDSKKLVANAISNYNSLGLSVKTATEDSKKEYNIDSGLEITDIKKFSEGFKAGLKTGDIIIQVGNQKVKTIKDLSVYIDKLNAGSSVKLFIQPGDGSYKRYVYMEIPSSKKMEKE